MIVLVLTVLIINSAAAENFTCHMNFFNFCSFEGVTSNTTDYQLEATFNGTIEKIQFQNSNLSVTTSEICGKFPFLKVLRLWSLSVETIADRALENCQQLKILSFYDNKLTKIDDKLLVDNAELEDISFFGNLIQEIHSEAFTNNKKLMKVDLQDNKLKQFELTSSLPVLMQLNLKSNLLEDLQIDDLLKRVPNLKQLNIGDNEFKCERLKEIITSANKRRVELLGTKDFKNERKPEHFIGNLDCIEPGVREKLEPPKAASEVDIWERVLLEISLLKEEQQSFKLKFLETTEKILNELSRLEYKQEQIMMKLEINN